MGFRGGLLVGVVVLSAATGAQAAVLPLGGQVNNDAAVGIDPTKDAGAVDVSAGSLTAGVLQAPWVAFEQATTGAQNIFVRSFADGAWTTEGFPASLNIDTTQDASAPAIDFAGAGRAVPWVSWDEPNTNLSGGGPTQIFASRFAANISAAGGGQWLHEGQDRTVSSHIPSLNIHTGRTAKNPSVAGGATTAGADPLPWVAWEENDGLTSDSDLHRQIFVSRGIKQSSGAAPCSGKPVGNNSVGLFCWQQVGLERLAPSQASITSSSSGDPTLNVDPTRAAVEPDIAFTGASDVVPWVVWYEQGNSELASFRAPEKDQVFAAKAVSDNSADGLFHWQAVGAGTAGLTEILSAPGTGNHFGDCADSQAKDDACSLNAVASNDAENPRVAAGSLSSGSPAVPWVVWQEDPGNGLNQIFLSRLVGGDHFALFNAGVPLSNTLDNATDPDITFVGHEPYISWHESVSGVDRLFLGHFEGGAASPAFQLDTPGGIAPSSAGTLATIRTPLSSTCTATPFSTDGDSCPGGAIGTPFAAITDAGTPHKLSADAYAPDVVTGAASAVTSTGATLAGTVTAAAPAVAGLEYGTSTAYGTQTSAPFAPGPAAQALGATLTGLTPSTTYHFRARARSDFTTVTGSDATFTTAAPATGGGGGTPPTNARPSSRIAGLAGSIAARKLKAFHGTASDPDDGVARVDIALVRLVGRAHASAAKARCFVMTARGRLVAHRPVRNACRPVFVKAKGRTSWRFALVHRLPRGHYVLYSRATDHAGQRELGFTKANRRAFRVT